MKLCHSLWTSPSLNRRLQYQRNLPKVTEVQWDIADLTFFRKNDYQYCHLEVDLLQGNVFPGYN